MSIHTHNATPSAPSRPFIPRILIAEDDELQASVLCETLRGRGYDADFVRDGREAVRRLCQVRYDVALIDYHLPEVDGLAAARLMQDLVRAEDRPRLIAVTAAAGGLQARELLSGVTAFDTVISKQQGLPALLSSVDASLAERAGLQALAAGQISRSARRRRLRAVLAAVPSLAMVAAFLVALTWTRSSLEHVDVAIGATHRLGSLSLNTGALVGAMADAEASQRTYMLTGNPSNRELFEADAERLGRMLVSPTSFTADGTPGFGAAVQPQPVIEERLATLMQEAQTRGAAKPAPDTGRRAADWLRAWASGVVGGAETATVAGLEGVHYTTAPVLLVLAAGAVWGLMSAIGTVRRRWRAQPRNYFVQAGPRMIVESKPALLF